MAARYDYSLFTNPELTAEETRLRALRQKTLSSWGDSGATATTELARIDAQYNDCAAEIRKRGMTVNGRTLATKRIAQSGSFGDSPRFGI